MGFDVKDAQKFFLFCFCDMEMLFIWLYYRFLTENISQTKHTEGRFLHVCKS